MIKHLRVENFKSIRKLGVDCKRVNILIGEPNSGKSNFLKALGTFAYAFTFDNVTRRIDLRSLTGIERMYELFFDQEITKPIVVEADEQSIQIRAVVDALFPYVFSLLKNETEVDVARLYDDGFGDGMTNMKFSLIHPYYFYDLILPRSRSGPFLWPPYGDNLLQILVGSVEIRELVGALVQKYGMELVLKPGEHKIELQKRKKGVAVSWPFRSLSGTLQRLIFYFSAIETNKEATLLFEEPESHMFPCQVKLLGEVIATNHSNQYFISTHDPNLLFSIIEKTPKEDLNVLITHLENEETRINPLDKRGIEKALDLGSSVFFNLEELIGE